MSASSDKAFHRGRKSPKHKVLTYVTYVEYRAVSGVFQNIIDSQPSERVLPRTKGGGYTTEYTEW
jgi:hypothetical protein